MSRTVTLAGYVVLVGLMVVTQVAALMWRRTVTLGQVLAKWRRTTAVRWVLVAGWLWVGLHFFVRSHH